MKPLNLITLQEAISVNAKNDGYIPSCQRHWRYSVVSSCCFHFVFRFKNQGKLSDRRERRLADKPDFPRLADETKERGKLQVEGREVGLRLCLPNEDRRRWI
jgi:hypothetical protein